eukprot:TRINITY_DN32057_c0_g1_i1.p1 TRINITY_DN32057_c0_g1~~TRINITY_DN32057_c0_g1_i1.p1  ORF type:complete len:259 (+),score=113.19 TRINITY_DN32057_c0_g1_i1:72-848(+)
MMRQATRAATRAVRTSRMFTVSAVGQADTLEWAAYYEKDGKKVSPWHSIPLFADETQNHFNYVNEIPSGTRAKMEVATKVEMNPIKQDVKKGKLRFFTYGDIPFNYGCLPRTWEDPKVGVADCGGAGGDNDPLDVVEISPTPLAMGVVRPVKVLGVLAMIDEGETDWKVIACDPSLPFNTLADLKKDSAMNEKLASVVHWFRYYKTTDGKPENSFGFNSEFQDEGYTLKVIKETSEQYDALVGGKAENPKNLWLPGSA